MCGLTGVLLHPGRRTRRQWTEIHDLIRSSLVFSEERGRDASGLAVVDRSGRIEILKRPMPSSDLVTLDEFQDLLNTVGPDTTCVLGHTRKPTKGGPEVDANNHPIPTHHLVGIHNGHIDNDDELFDELGFERAGQVDSEIIFRLLDNPHHPITGPAHLAEIRYAARQLEGTFATLSVDLRTPHRLLALKRLRPLCLHYEPPHRALYFSSRYIFLRKSFGRTVVTEALEPDRGYLFAADEIITRGGEPLAWFPITDSASRTEPVRSTVVLPAPEKRVG